MAPWRREAPALPSPLRTIYLIGICGTGMGSLAGMLRAKGFGVVGSDTAIYPPMSDQLAAAQIVVLPGWNPQNIRDAGADLVVVGNVCRKDNPELLEAQALGLVCMSFPEVLRLLFLERCGSRMVVTGTHGKTTTSTLLAWFLERVGRAPSFMIGGITGNWGSNYKLDAGDVFVIEGDEYDTACFDKVPKFWHYEPTTLLINNIEFDHADIYGSVEEIEGVFRVLVERLPQSAEILANLDDVRVRGVVGERGVQGVGFGEHNHWRAVDIGFEEGGGASFRVLKGGEDLGILRSPLVGEHNIRNVLMAVAGVCSAGGGQSVLLGEIQDALDKFKSVKKRQERVGEHGGVLIYDDFAHHPTAVRETVAGIRNKHPKARLWGVFEAKSNTSRRAVFQHDYPEALALCDVVVMSSPWKKDDLPPDQLINLPQVVEDLKRRGVEAHLIPNVEEIVVFMVERLRAGDVVLGMSGSSFGGFHKKLLDAWRAR
jgi:UDP-N-acetylmuramate: L-alanyl-gamma-D-glutamyl-meso-diaminopimelate ligase